MRVRILKSKIHRATVTNTNLDYTGSITIDEDLMDAVGIHQYEQVLVANLTNGTRHETYVVSGKRGSGVILVMGAAAHLVNTGDKVIIMAFADIKEKNIADHKPRVVLVDENNHIVKNMV
jgi:aspartate 1-decarboxylase